MTQWWLILLGGLLGSTHCLGMCGPFAAMIGLHAGSPRKNLQAQLLYSLGRLMSYATLGAVAGFAGRYLIRTMPQITYIPAILCLLAGALLVREGILASGILPRRVAGRSTVGCLLKPFFSTILKTPGLRNTFAAGVLTGLMPCGLVYAFVSLAGSSGDLVQGMLIMVLFGLGTVPLMVITGCGISAVSFQMREKLWKVAAWSVVITGLLTIGRGGAFLWASTAPQDACPFCAGRSVTPQVKVTNSVTPVAAGQRSTGEN
ncbi:MAG: sulfite exporter TauE/SafE family protein [Planctomycetales bacterium]